MSRIDANSVVDDYARGEAAFRQLLVSDHPPGEALQVLHAMITGLAERVVALTARLDENDAAAREAGAGENTIDYAALEEAERDDPAKQWTSEDEAAHQAELPHTLPHQP